MNEFDVRATEWDTPQRVELALKVAVEIIGNVDLNDSMDVMEYGCGTGLLGLHLVEKVKSATFLDTSVGMLDVLADKIEQREVQNTQIHNVDLSVDVAFTGKYDLILSSMTFHHIADTKALVNRLSGLLKPEGKLVVVDLVAEDGSFHSDGFDGHNGFDVGVLCEMFRTEGLKVANTSQFMDLVRDNGRRYPLFIIVGQK